MIMKKISGKMKTPILKTEKKMFKICAKEVFNCIHTKYKYNCESTVIYE
mgnify:CR=1 FL=1